MKKIPTAIAVIKEDRQAFGLLVSKAGSLTEAFAHPITSVPLSIANADSTLRQSEKASLQRFLVNESQCVKSVPPQNAVWIVDGMAAVRSLKPKPTYRAWMNSLINFITPEVQVNANEVHIVNDSYFEKSVKNETRRKRGEPGPRVHLEGYDQNMLQGAKWQEFLHRNENKNDLIQLLARFLKEDGVYNGTIPLVFTSSNATFRVCDGTVAEVDECNHEEADTRLILHAAASTQDVVIVAKDTDVLVLMVWAYVVLNVEQKWYFKKDHDKFVDIGEICSYLGREICLRLPALHAISGCDTTSYFYNVGKVKLIKKVLKSPERLALLDSLGKERELGDRDMEEVQEFVRVVMYPGKENESYVATRVRLYWQAYHWLRCTVAQVEVLPFEDCGWKWVAEESSIKPIWFTCSQLPPSLQRRRQTKKARVTRISDGEDANDENSSRENDSPPTKRRRREKPNKQTNCDNVYSADSEDNNTHHTSSEVEEKDTSNSDECESDWEVLDFSSSDDSGDDWIS